MRHSTKLRRGPIAAFEDVAIIGMAGRFPGAQNLDELRQGLERGADHVGPLSEKRIVDTALSRDAEYLVAGYLDDIDKFDHRFFGISLGEAQTMSPHLRMVLEVVVETFESSGYGIEHFSGSDTAVYASQSGSSNHQHADQLVPTLITGNSPNFFATRIARQFDLTGLAVMVDTACSSSMTALHLACQALACGDAEHALVCGSNIQVFPMKGDHGKLFDALAPDGRSRAFSASAAGMSIGEMVAAVLLKPLRHAVADGDLIHGVIKAVAVNNNGAMSSSSSAPDSVMQARVIQAAWTKAGLDPETLGFIEAHGSGTKLGDSLEIEALSLVFRAHTERAAICPISTIKGNIGHGHSSAGLAGLLKAVLSLKHAVVFPAVHFDEPSPLIDFSKSAVYVNDKRLPFRSVPGEPRRAAVHAFGMSGVNGHVVLEEAPPRAELAPSADGPHLVTLSSRTPDGLRRTAAALRAGLEARPELSLRDIAFTLNVGRSHFDCRACLVPTSRDELLRGLETICDGAVPAAAAVWGKLVAAFSGSIEPPPELIAALASRHAEFGRVLRECDDALAGERAPRAVVFQYAAYRTLACYGILPATILAIGPGIFPNRIVEGTLGLAEGLRESRSTLDTSSREWMPKLERLLDGTQGGVPTTFLELGIQGALAREARATIEARPGFRLIAPELGCGDPLIDVLAPLYLAGHTPDFLELHAQFPGQRLDLPGYQFEKTRCWLRDTPKRNPFEDDARWIESGATPPASTRLVASDVEAVIRGYSVELIGNADIPSDANSASSAMTIASVGAAEHHEPSPAQKNLWVLCQLARASAAYNLSVYHRIEGALDIQALTAAVDTVVARHESLRTSFIVVNEEPRQRIAPPGGLGSAIRFIDVSERATPLDGAIEAVNEELARPFDLEAGPLFRTLLLKVGRDSHVLCFCAHHIIVDPWSFDVILSEVVSLYEARRAGRESRLPTLPIQYKDYAAWLNAQLADGHMQLHLDYWKAKLRGLPPPFEIETDRPRPALKSFRGGLLRRMLPPNTAAALRSACEQHCVTPFIVLLSVVKALLHRYTELSDLTVGTPMAGRDLPELDGQVGLYMNLVPLRTRVDGSRPFTELLSAVKQTVIEAQQHQAVPFDVLVKELSPVRDMGRSLLVDVLVSMQKAGLRARANRRSLSVNIEELEAEHAISRYDLTFEFSEMPEGIQLELEYNVDLYDAQRIEHVARDFSTLADRFLAEPQRAVGAIAFPGGEACAARSVALAARAGEGVGLHSLIIEQCERTPDAIALVAEEGALSYRELGVRAARLAHRLRSWGIGPEDHVAICMEKTLDLPIAMLGALMAGAAFVPLDPTFPRARLVDMVRGCAAKVILCGDSHLGLFETAPCPVVPNRRWVDAEPGPAAAEPAVLEAGLAYTLFTSGSTGEPKGVQVAHGSVVAFLRAMSATIEVGSRDVLVSVTAPTFDIAILELFLPLARGGRVVLALARNATDVATVLDTIMRERPTLLQATPSTWKFLIAAGADGIVPPTVLCGGEALSVELSQTLSAGGRTLWNLYGPTETTIWSMVERVPANAVTVPIGTPIPGTTAYVLDRALELRPLGFSGELVLGGAGLARGYARSPDVTAAAFVPDGYSNVAGARMYRTGDKAVVPLHGGAIEFRGRRDSQVKVRGYRVELGEVERALARHASVEAVAVTPNGATEEMDGLVAHIVPRPGAALNVEELKAFLRTILPTYMIPSTCTVLDALPLTSSGKVDRVKLQFSAAARPVLPQPFQPPSAGLEELIADVWKRLVGVEVGRADNFFDIGGQSLTIVKAYARLQTALQRTFPLLLLFQCPTVAQLALALSGDAEEKAARDSGQANSRGAMQRAAFKKQVRTHEGGARQ
jgi:amino acid adenylation domain-containing protein